MSLRNMYGGLLLRSAAVAVPLATVVACAPISLERRVGLTEANPRVYQATMFTYGNGYDNELRTFIEKVTEMYHDKKLGNDARTYGNAVTITPTGSSETGKYGLFRIVVKWDDGDKRPTPGDGKKGDITLHNRQKGKDKEGTYVTRDAIPNALLDLMVNVKSAVPETGTKK